MYWNGQGRATTFINSTRLDATINAADIAAAGSASVTVRNPAGTLSNALTFTINAGGLVGDWYVSTSGNNAWDGTTSTFQGGSVGPKRNVSNGIALLSAGKTLAILAGTYTSNADAIAAGSVPSGNNFSGGETKLIGAGVGQTIIKPASARGIFLENQSNIEFRDFELDMSAANPGPGASDWEGVEIQATTFNIRFLRFYVHHGRQNFSDESTCSNFELIKVESSHAGIPECQSSGDVGGGLCHGAYLQGSTHTIDKCNSHHNNGLGFQLYPSTADNITIKNTIAHKNRLYTAPATGAPTGILMSGTNFKCFNNSCYDNEGFGIWAFSGTTGEIANCVAFGNDAGQIQDDGSMTETTNQTTDPSWVNAESANFHLQSGSTARDTGTTKADVPDDYDGVSRPQGSAYCKGAFEFV